MDANDTVVISRAAYVTYQVMGLMFSEMLPEVTKLREQRAMKRVREFQVNCRHFYKRPEGRRRDHFSFHFWADAFDMEIDEVEITPDSCTMVGRLSGKAWGKREPESVLEGALVFSKARRWLPRFPLGRRAMSERIEWVLSQSWPLVIVEQWMRPGQWLAKLAN